MGVHAAAPYLTDHSNENKGWPLRWCKVSVAVVPPVVYLAYTQRTCLLGVCQTWLRDVLVLFAHDQIRQALSALRSSELLIAAYPDDIPFALALAAACCWI